MCSIDLVENVIPSRNFNFIGREEYFEKIDKFFFIDKIRQISLNSNEPGTGKSSLALEYGYRFIEKDPLNNHVYWIKSDSKSLDIEIEILIKYLGLNYDYVLSELRYGTDSLKEKILFYDKKILIIFDDYKKDTNINIEFLLKQNNVFAIFNSNKSFHEIELKGFTQREAVYFIKNSIQGKIKHDTEINDIFRIFGLKTQKYITPLELTTIVGYIKFKTGKIKSLKAFINDLLKENRIIDKSQLDNKLFEIFLKKEIQAWELLKYLIFLDADFAPVDMLIDILECDEDDLNKCVLVLKKLSLINVCELEGLTGLKIHRQNQHRFLAYVSPNEFEIVCERLKKIFIKHLNNDLFRRVQYTENKSKKIYIHQFKTILDLVLDYNQKIDDAKRASFISLFAKYLSKDAYTYNQSIRYYEISLDINRYLNENSLVTAQILNNIAGVYAKLGKQFEAVCYYEKSLDVFHINKEFDTLDVAFIMKNIAMSYQKLEKCNSALEFYEKALSIFRPYFANNYNKNITDCLNYIGSVFRKIGNYNPALEIYEKLLDFYKIPTGNELNKNVARIFNKIGTIFNGLGNFTESLSYHHKTLVIHKSLIQTTKNVDDLDVANCMKNIGKVYDQIGNFNKALNYFLKTIEIYKNIFKSENNFEIALCYYCIGNVYNKKGNFNSAFAYLNKGLIICLKVLDTNTGLSEDKIFNTIGMFYIQMEEYEKAKQYFELVNNKDGNFFRNIGDCFLTYDESKIFYEEALRLYQEQFENAYNSDCSLMLYKLGSNLEVLNTLDEMIELQEQSLKIRKKLNGINNLNVVYNLNMIGLITFMQKKHDEALEYFQSALNILEHLNENCENIYMAELLNNIGCTYAGLEEEENAMICFRKSYSILKSLNENDDVIRVASACSKFYLKTVNLQENLTKTLLTQ